MGSRWVVNYTILVNGILYWGSNPLILTFDTNFVGHVTCIQRIAGVNR